MQGCGSRCTGWCRTGPGTAAASSAPGTGRWSSYRVQCWKERPTFVIRRKLKSDGSDKPDGDRPGGTHGLLKVGDGAVVQHHVTRDVQGDQVGQTLDEDRQDLPGHLELGIPSALPGNIQVSGEEPGERRDTKNGFIIITTCFFMLNVLENASGKSQGNKLLIILKVYQETFPVSNQRELKGFLKDHNLRKENQLL